MQSGMGVEPESSRIFLSYSHTEQALAESIAEHLRTLGATVWWDQSMDAGERFTDFIKRSIARAHIFMPIITPQSLASPWVHQEIGYATGLNVPVLPIAIGALPSEMIQQLHGATIRVDLSNLAAVLTRDMVRRCVRRGDEYRGAMYEVAIHAFERATTLVRNAQDALETGGPSIIRQGSDLSSFAIPDRPVHHPDWTLRDGAKTREPPHREALRDERVVMEKHARKAGCALIIDPFFPIAGGEEARRFRIARLIEFLSAMPNELVRAAVRTRPPEDVSSTVIVGDWFVASSVSPRADGGYLETRFTWHAPTVRRHIERFDKDLLDLLDEQGLSPAASREAAIATLEEVLRRPPSPRVGRVLYRRPELMREIGTLEGWINKAQSRIRILGNDCKLAVCSLTAEIANALERGVEVEILLVKPGSPAAAMLAQVDPRFGTPTDVDRSLADVIDTLRRLQSRPDGGRLRYRLLAVLPAFGLVSVDADRGGVLKGELYCAKPWPKDERRPDIVFPPDWRDFFLSQWANYWNLAEESMKPG